MHPIPVEMALTLARLRQQDVRDSFPRRPRREPPDASTAPARPTPTAPQPEPRPSRPSQHRPATA